MASSLNSAADTAPLNCIDWSPKKSVITASKVPLFLDEYASESISRMFPILGFCSGNAIDIPNSSDGQEILTFTTKGSNGPKYTLTGNTSPSVKCSNSPNGRSRKSAKKPAMF